MFWQSSIIHYILLLFSVCILYELILKKKFWLSFLPALGLLLQVLSGIQYLRLASFMKSFYF
jgi:hypothetical protein